MSRQAQGPRNTSAVAPAKASTASTQVDLTRASEQHVQETSRTARALADDLAAVADHADAEGEDAVGVGAVEPFEGPAVALGCELHVGEGVTRVVLGRLLVQREGPEGKGGHGLWRRGQFGR